MTLRKFLPLSWATGILVALPLHPAYAECNGLDPEQLTEQMAISYPHGWKTYRDGVHGFSVRIPPQWTVEKNEDKGGIDLGIDWCGGEPGSSTPFIASVRIFDTSAYRPVPPKATYPPPGKTVYLTVAEIRCGDHKFKQETFEDDAGEMSTSVMHRIAFVHGHRTYEWNFSYVISGIVSGNWAGSDSPRARKYIAEEKKFIAENEDLKCQILSTLAFIGN